MVAHSDKTERAIVRCVDCGSAYGARTWPDGEVQLIGTTGCRCGSDEFEILDVSSIP